MKFAKLLCFAGAAVLLLSGTAGAQETATLTGKVVDATNAPVEGATILMGRNGPAYMTLVGEDMVPVTTDGSGNFAGNLPATDQRVNPPRGLA